MVKKFYRKRDKDKNYGSLKTSFLWIQARLASDRSEDLNKNPLLCKKGAGHPTPL